MIYVLSDLHGCYDKYLAMLDKIKLSKNDTLYVLGDIVDRGSDGIKIILDIMKRRNVVPMLGNHEILAYSVLQSLNTEITEDNYNKTLSKSLMIRYEDWMNNGGYPTLNSFTCLHHSQRNRILDYFEDFSVYEELNVNGKEFILVHAGLSNFSAEKGLHEYELEELLYDRCDYSKAYFEDKYLVTGHTPTIFIDPDYKGRIYKKNNHIAIDCGTIFGNPLGCICLDTFEEYYVN